MSVKLVNKRKAQESTGCAIAQYGTIRREIFKAFRKWE